MSSFQESIQVNVLLLQQQTASEMRSTISSSHSTQMTTASRISMIASCLDHSFSSFRSNAKEFVRRIKWHMRGDKAKSTWLPLDLRARFNEAVYGYREVYNPHVGFGTHRDSVEMLVPEAVRDAVLDRYYEEERRRLWSESESMVVGLGGASQIRT